MSKDRIVLREIIDVEGNSRFDKPMFTKTGPTVLPVGWDVLVTPHATKIRSREKKQQKFNVEKFLRTLSQENLINQ